MPYGVSEHMVETYGELIFDLSLNKQVRRGDPIRLLDHAAWLEQREATGLTDPEIAGKTGLAIEQVTFIRNITERRVFRLNQYRKLFRLGGGLRYREGRYQDPEEKFIISDDAVALRQAMHFTPSEVKKYIEAGDWNDEVLGDLLATIDPDKSAIVVPERGTSFGYNTLVSDMRALPVLAQTGCPIVFDATHSVQQPGGQGGTSGGQREFVPVLARAAVAIGVAAVFMETHADPDSAPSDGPNMVPLAQMPALLDTLKAFDDLAKSG